MMDLLLYFGYPIIKGYLIIGAVFILIFSLLDIISDDEPAFSFMDYFLVLLLWPAILNRLLT
jgi:hypothetical protein